MDVGKRTLRTLHFEMVARHIKHEREEARVIGDSPFQNAALVTLRRLAYAFAAEFEVRAVGFNRAKFLEQCGLER